MSYTALYRKFRPDNFEEVKGQEHIVQTLANQILADRIGHAYLFCGTRGTGKTSIAKIFAKTVNCENLQDGKPCNKCSSCKSIAAGANMDVIELDAASNNGVDNIREIVEKVSYSPAQSKYKVYIIDEVHMLSIGAFNALLKTLEEPPAYAIFILATTEANKIPITILSRCQRYDFKRISTEIIAKRLEELVAIEQLPVDPKALLYIAKMGDGSMRDALSLLEQCLAFHYQEVLTYEHVLDVLGAVDTKVFDEFLTYIIGQDILPCIQVIEEITMQGREYTQFISDFTWYLRNILLIKTAKNKEDLVKLQDVIGRGMDQINELCTMVQPLDVEDLYRYIRIFSEVSGQMKYATQKRVLLETTVIKLCKPAMETDYDSLIGRIRLLEEQLEKGVVVTNSQLDPVAQMPTGEKIIPKELPKALPKELQYIGEQWNNLLMKMGSPLKQYLRTANISVGQNNTLLIVIPDGVAYDYFGSNPERVQWVQTFLSQELEKEVTVEIKKREVDRLFEMDYPNLEKIITMTIEEEN